MIIIETYHNWFQSIDCTPLGHRDCPIQHHRLNYRPCWHKPPPFPCTYSGHPQRWRSKDPNLFRHHDTLHNGRYVASYQESLFFRNTISIHVTVMIFIPGLYGLMQKSRPRDNIANYYVLHAFLYTFLYTFCASDSSHMWSIVALWINGRAVVAASQVEVTLSAVVSSR